MGFKPSPGARAAYGTGSPISDFHVTRKELYQSNIKVNITYSSTVLKSAMTMVVLLIMKLIMAVMHFN